MTTTTEEFRMLLADAIYESREFDALPPRLECETEAEAEKLGRDEGLVVTLRDGSEFVLRIEQRR